MTNNKVYLTKEETETLLPHLRTYLKVMKAMCLDEEEIIEVQDLCGSLGLGLHNLKCLEEDLVA